MSVLSPSKRDWLTNLSTCMHASHGLLSRFVGRGSYSVDTFKIKIKSTLGGFSKLSTLQYHILQKLDHTILAKLLIQKSGCASCLISHLLGCLYSVSERSHRSDP